MPFDRFSRVLAVEDSPPELRLLCDILEEDGFEVVGCMSALDGLAKVRQGPPFGVVIVDLNLPDMDGVALLSEILKIDPNLRVIIYTGSASYDSVKQAINLGAFGYIEKLSDPGDLLKQVHRARTARVGRYAADLESAVAERTAELARSNQELQSFASVVAHDLRSPLLTISGYCEIIKEEFGAAIAPDAVEYLEHIVTAVKRMSNLIDDLLDYSRAGRAREPLRAVELNIVLKQVIENLDGPIREASARVEVGPLPAVMGDQTQLVQVFQNLVANAIKFRGSREPVVQLTATSEDKSWRIDVADNGIGIEEKDFDRIFQVFQRLHGKEFPGTGIGLALCKKIVDRHGGRIWPTSRPGEGVTFHVALSAVPGDQPRTNPVAIA